MVVPSDRTHDGAKRRRTTASGSSSVVPHTDVGGHGAHRRVTSVIAPRVPSATDQQTAQVVPGDVLDRRPAGAHLGAVRSEKARAEEGVAHRPEPQPSVTGEARGQDTPDGRRVVTRVEGARLSLFREHGTELGDRRARRHGRREIRRFVREDAGGSTDLDTPGRDASHLPLGAAAHRHHPVGTTDHCAELSHNASDHRIRVGSRLSAFVTPGVAR